MKLIQEFAPVLLLLAAALLVFGGTKMARHFGAAEALGCGVALCLIAVAIGLSPATWRAAWAGGDWGDRLLTYARIVGFSGMLFLAGTRFESSELRGRAKLIFKTIVAAAVVFALFVLSQRWLPVDLSSMVLLAASVIASSLWFSRERHRTDKNNEPEITSQVTALVFTTCAFLAVYFFDVLSFGPCASSRVSTYIITGSYEAVKVFVVFGFAYFICSRFLARAQGRVSSIRTTIGFVLIAILIFGLTLITTNELGAFAWAFVAGVLWRRSDMGIGFGQVSRPATAATLASLVFVPLTLQTHGRSLSDWPTLVGLVAVAIAIKAACAWIVIRTAKAPVHGVTRLAIALAGPGEMGVALLGFAITRWFISSQFYFAILGYALISTVLIPSSLAATTALDTRTSRRSVMEKQTKKVLLVNLLLVILILVNAATVSAQQVSPAPAIQEVQLGRGMSLITPGLMEIGSQTKLFLAFGDKLQLSAEQRKNLEDLYIRIQTYSFQREADLDVADAELKRLLTRDTVDLAAVKQKMKDIEGIRLEVDIKKIETLLQAINALSHEQHLQVILLARDLEQANKPRAPIFQ